MGTRRRPVIEGPPSSVGRPAPQRSPLVDVFVSAMTTGAGVVLILWAAGITVPR